MKASEIIKEKLIRRGGSVTIPQLNNKRCNIKIVNNSNSFSSDKLNNYKIVFNFQIFDVITNFLKHRPEYKAPKGNSRGKDSKVGYGKCTNDTITYVIAKNYFGKKDGESTLDPVFVLAAVLDWAEIAENQRGFVQLKPDFIVQ